MPSLLAIQSSPRGDYSVSSQLTAKFIEEWKADHAGGTVVSRDLTTTELPFVDQPWIAGAYPPAERHSPEMKKALRISDELIAELMAADHIVFGTSMYNFSIPANLKAYIDHVVRIGVTFTPTYEGLVQGKKATVMLASGGNYAPGTPTESYNVGVRLHEAGARLHRHQGRERRARRGHRRDRHGQGADAGRRRALHVGRVDGRQSRLM